MKTDFFLTFLLANQAYKVGRVYYYQRQFQSAVTILRDSCQLGRQIARQHEMKKEKLMVR